MNIYSASIKSNSVTRQVPTIIKIMTPGILRSSVPVDGEGDIPEPSILPEREKSYNLNTN